MVGRDAQWRWGVAQDVQPSTLLYEDTVKRRLCGPDAQLKIRLMDGPVTYDQPCTFCVCV